MTRLLKICYNTLRVGGVVLKKKLVLGILILFTLTGCANLNNQSIEDLTSRMLSINNTLANVVFDGYKYYVPRGLKLDSKDEYNAVLIDESNNRYYFYIDVISYYNNEQLTYTSNNEAYYSSELDENDKVGYLEITKVGNNGYYFIEYMYNYGKFEAYVEEKDINSAIINMSSVLSSLKFNRDVLETIIGNKVLNYQEDTYNVMKPKGNTATKDTYLEYEEKYGIYEGYDITNDDENIIEIEEN